MKKHYLPNMSTGSVFPISKIGYPFVFFFAFITLIFAILDIVFLSLFFLILTVFVCFFFRDPDRSIPIDPLLVVSPADGKIIKLDKVDNIPYVEGKYYKISIFMSVFNVHVNRSPYHGKVDLIDYYPGQFFSAHLNKSSEKNEKNVILIKTDNGLSICFVQIAGLIARRIICNVRKGEKLEKGQKFGIICFGSRLDLYVPLCIKLKVKKGDKVLAGSSVIGELLDVTQEEL